MMMGLMTSFFTRIGLLGKSTMKGKIPKVCHDLQQGISTSKHTGRSGRDSHGRVSRMMC
jgi:hypothetical protein